LKKLLFILLVLSFLVSLLLTATTSQAFIHLDDATVPLPPVSIAQTLSDVKSFSCDDVTVVPVSECEALVDLYLSTNGAAWLKKNNWLISLDVSTWFGITVTNQHVSVIELSTNNVVGEISTTISDLPYLIELCLTSNQVSGVIPESISLISTMEKLSLDSNNLSGSIPESLTLMLNLSKISLGHNQLTGTIPASIGDLPALERLEIHDNEISGELPESLGQATNLLYLIIFFNPIEGKIPLSYTNLTNITDFYFFGTQLCEPTTPEFLAWKTLVGDGWQGTGQICMDYHNYLPIVCR
jgi:Leucine-rich repeat (LRR) protein